MTAGDLTVGFEPRPTEPDWHEGVASALESLSPEESPWGEIELVPGAVKVALVGRRSQHDGDHDAGDCEPE